MSVHDPFTRALFERGDARRFRFVVKKLARQPPPLFGTAAKIAKMLASPVHEIRELAEDKLTANS